jgi:uncharacterized membrane protein
MVGLIIGVNVMGVMFHAYESMFITLNLISIAVGFYYTYLHKVKKNCNHDHCHSRNKKVYWIVTVISLLLMIIPHVIE